MTARTEQKRESGFTLIEIIIVVVILGILATVVVMQVSSAPEQARIVKAKQDIMSIETALDLYKMDNGSYPTTDQGLLALIKKPEEATDSWKATLKRLPKDPWGHDYQYLSPGEHSDIDIFTPGGHSNASETTGGLIGNWIVDSTSSTRS